MVGVPVNDVGSVLIASHILGLGRKRPLFAVIMLRHRWVQLIDGTTGTSCGCYTRVWRPSF